MANGRNGDAAVVPQAVMGQMMPLPIDGSVVTPPDAQRAGPVPKPATLASALASANPANQIVMLGEHLYPFVQHLEHEHVGKVTGMLLEMDQTEVLHLIESPDALKKKVAEAMDVLRLENIVAAENASLPSDCNLMVADLYKQNLHGANSMDKFNNSRSRGSNISMDKF